jgi:hypothetical protein
VWCFSNTFNYFRVFRPECCVARRRHSPAMTSPRALPRAEIHRNSIQGIQEAPHLRVQLSGR